MQGNLQPFWQTRLAATPWFGQPGSLHFNAFPVGNQASKAPLGLKLEINEKEVIWFNQKLAEQRVTHPIGGTASSGISLEEGSCLDSATRNHSKNKDVLYCLSLTLGNLQCESKDGSKITLISCCAKRKVTVDFFTGSVKGKVEVSWETVSSTRTFSVQPEMDACGHICLELDLKDAPACFKETAPDPKRPVTWTPCKDFIGSQRCSNIRRLHLTLPVSEAMQVERLVGELNEQNNQVAQSSPRMSLCSPFSMELSQSGSLGSLGSLVSMPSQETVFSRDTDTSSFSGMGMRMGPMTPGRCAAPGMFCGGSPPRMDSPPATFVPLHDVAGGCGISVANSDASSQGPFDWGPFESNGSTPLPGTNGFNANLFAGAAPGDPLAFGAPANPLVGVWDEDMGSPLGSGLGCDVDIGLMTPPQLRAAELRPFRREMVGGRSPPPMRTRSSCVGTPARLRQLQRTEGGRVAKLSRAASAESPFSSCSSSSTQEASPSNWLLEEQQHNFINDFLVPDLF